MDDLNNITPDKCTDGSLISDSTEGSRQHSGWDNGFCILEWKVLPAQNRLVFGNREIVIGPKSMDVLVTLAQAGGDTVSKDDIVLSAWKGLIVSDDSIHRAVSKLRKALAVDARLENLVITVPRRGYRLNVELADLSPDRPFQTTTRAAKTLSLFKPLQAVAGIAALLVLAALIALYPFQGKQGSTGARVSYRSVPVTSFMGQERAASFAPSSDAFVFAWSGDDQKQWDLYWLKIGEWTPHALTSDSTIEFSPVWSPNGDRIAYSAVDGDVCEIRILTIETGESASVKACTAPGDTDLAWSPSGNGIYYTDRVGLDGPLAVHFISLDNGSVRQISFPPTEYFGDNLPAISPDGTKLAVARTRDVGVTDIYTVDLNTGSEQRITFDCLKIHGLGWSEDGSLIYSSNRNGGFGLWKTPGKGGEPIPLTDPGANADSVVIAPGGQRLIYESEKTLANLKLIELQGADFAEGNNLSPSSGWEWHPSFSNSGEQITFISDRSGSAELWLSTADGQNPRQLSAHGGPYLMSPTWSPGEKYIAYAVPVEGNFDIYLMDIETGDNRRLTTHHSSDRSPVYDPAGENIYFSSSRTGRWEIWKMPASGGNVEQVTSGGGFRPLISDDGKFLYFTRREQPGIWRQMIGETDSQAERVVENLSPLDWSNWALDNDRLYLIERDDQFSTILAEYSLSAGTVLGRQPLPAISHHSGMTLTPDGSGLVFSETVNIETDLIMLEKEVPEPPGPGE